MAGLAALAAHRAHGHPRVAAGGALPLGIFRGVLQALVSVRARVSREGNVAYGVV